MCVCSVPDWSTAIGNIATVSGIIAAFAGLFLGYFLAKREYKKARVTIGVAIVLSVAIAVAYLYAFGYFSIPNIQNSKIPIDVPPVNIHFSVNMLFNYLSFVFTLVAYLVSRGLIEKRTKKLLYEDLASKIKLFEKAY